jgi:putative IMPACT (imprinted ancient) family translation regulator
MSIKQASYGIYKDKGSKFFAKAFPLKDLEEIKNRLGLLKSAHMKARHICYAYRLGFTPEKNRSHDNGKPAGLREKRFKILYFCSIYILFFGLCSLIRRTLLGVPRLIHAYKEAGADALKNAEIVTIIPEINL